MNLNITFLIFIVSISNSGPEFTWKCAKKDVLSLLFTSAIIFHQDTETARLQFPERNYPAFLSALEDKEIWYGMNEWSHVIFIKLRKCGTWKCVKFDWMCFGWREQRQQVDCCCPKPINLYIIISLILHHRLYCLDLPKCGYYSCNWINLNYAFGREHSFTICIGVEVVWLYNIWRWTLFTQIT